MSKNKNYRPWLKPNYSESKIQYFIDEEKRTIVAMMVDCKYDAINVFNGIGEVSFNSDFNFDKAKMNGTYRGKAKCSPEDEWNVEIGMQIARNRMLNKYYNARANALNYMAATLNSTLAELNYRVDYSFMRCEKAKNEEL